MNNYSLDEAREELDEFQISSRELETELEAQLELAETKAKDLGNQNTRLNIELDIVKVSFSTMQLLHPLAHCVVNSSQGRPE